MQGLIACYLLSCLYPPFSIFPDGLVMGLESSTASTPSFHLSLQVVGGNALGKRSKGVSDSFTPETCANRSCLLLFVSCNTLPYVEK